MLKRAALMLSLLALQTPLNAQNLVESGQALPGLHAGSAAWGDYDADGDQDLALMGEIDEGGQCLRIVRIYGNDEALLFEDQAPGQELIGAYYGDLAWADYDNDGDLDLAVVGWDIERNESLRLYLNDPSNDERVLALDRLQLNSDGESSLQGVRYATLAWGDYDNDGDPDLVVSGMGANGTSLTKLYQNDGGILLVDDINSEALVNLHNGDLAWGDYDNDGDLDLAVSGENTTTTGGLREVTEFYLNEPTGTLGLDPTITASAQVKGGALAWADYDSDGNLDLAIAGRQTNWGTSFQLYRNRPTGVLAVDATFNLNTTRRVDGDLAWIDYDNDGDLDLAATGRSIISDYQAFVFTGQDGRINGVSTETLLTGLAGGSANWADYDSDGRADLLLSGSDASGQRRTILYNNQGTTLPNNPPTPPQALNPPTVTSNRILFSWSPGTDSESDELTYNLRLGTEPGGNDFFSGVVTAGPGNTGFKTNKTLRRSLPPDTYFWSVQTVDGSYAQSAWSQEQILNVQQFVSSDQRIRALKEAAMDWGDYDDDGDLDLVIIGQNRSGEAQSLLYTNTNGEITVAADAGLSPLRAGDVDWGDYDNDGDLDLLLTGEDTFSNRAAMLYQTQTGALSLIGRFPDVSESAADWGDYDNDGDLDLVIIGQSNDVIDGRQQSYSRIFQNDGLGSFDQTDHELIGLNNGEALWGDYDGDGDLDLAATGSTTQGTREFGLYNNQAGQLVDALLDLPGLESSDLAWGDYDGDGDLDLAAGGISDTGLRTDLYVNDGNGAFVVLAGGDFTGIQGGDLTWGDYDNDRDLDLVVTGNDGTQAILQIYENALNRAGAAGDFVQDPISLLQGLDFSAASLVDIDGDGDLDLVSSGSTGGFDPSPQSIVNDNLTGEFNRNLMPTTPTPQAAADAGSDITLSWSSSSDDGDDTPLSLSYNLRVGTTVEGHEVLSGNIAHGRGNAGHSLQHQLKNLASGTYFWSVQAVDDGFARSEWSTTQSFVIDTVPPIVSPFAASRTQLGIGQTTTLALSFFDEHSGVSASTPPTVEAVIGTETIAFEQLQFTGVSWSGELTVGAEMPSGTAMIRVSGAIDAKNNEMIAFEALEAFTLDTELPTVIGATPAMAASGVSVEVGEIGITFSEAIDQQTILADNFQIRLGTTPLAQLSDPSYDEATNAVRLLPEGGLLPGSEYTIEVSAAIQDLAGNRPADATNWSFSTQIPQLVATSPAADALDAAGDGRITASFDAPIMNGMLAAVDVVAVLAQSEATPLRDEPIFDAETNTLVIQLADGFKPGTRYDVVLAGLLAGPLRTVSGGDFSWQFQTPVPDLIRMSPEGEVDAADIRVEAAFSSAIDADLLSAETVHITREGKAQTPTDLRFDEATNILSFDLVEGYKPGSRYEIILAGLLAGPLRSASGGDFSWQFQTAVPDLLSMRPEGEVDAADIRVEATFSSAIDADLISAETVHITREGEAQTPTDLRFDEATNELSFELVDGYKPGSRYEVTLAGLLAGPMRAVSGGDFTWQFQTRVPDLLSMGPEGKVEVAEIKVQAAFSSAIDASLLSGETVQITREGEAQTPIDLRFDETTNELSFELNDGYKPGSRYEITLAGLLAGPLRAVSGGDFTWQFQTPVPDLLSMGPEGEVDAAEIRVEAAFTSAIDVSLLNAETVQITREGEAQTPTDLRFDETTNELSFELAEGYKPGSRYEITLAALLAGPLRAVSGGDFTWQFQTSVPVMLAQSPMGEATTIGSTIEATFSSPIDEDLLDTPGTVQISLEGVHQTIKENEFDDESNVLSLQLEDDFKPGALYEVVLNGLLAGPLRAVAEGDFTWQFRTPIPELAASTPSADQAGVATADNTIVAVFDNPVDAQILLQPGNVTAFESGADVAIDNLEYVAETRTARLQLTEGLRSGTSYRLRIAAAAGGPRRQTDYSWVFQTAIPELTTATPADDSVDIGVDIDEVTLQFSAPVDTDQLTGDNFTLNRKGEEVELRVGDPIDRGDNTYGLAPAEGWQVGTRYTVQISPSVSGPLGSGQTETLTFSTDVPAVLATTPTTGDTTVIGLSAALEMRFDAPINQAALLTDGNVSLLQEGEAVAISTPAYDPENNSVRFAPVGGLVPGTAYRVSIAAGVGGPLLGNAGAYNWNFSTRIPSITATDPVDGSDVRSGSQRLTITFSSPVNPQLVNSRNFTLSRRGSAIELPDDEFSYDAETFTVSYPPIELRSGTAYEASVSSRVSGPLAAQNRLRDRNWIFTTEIPRIISTLPAADTDGISTSETNLQIIFSEPAARQDAADFQISARALGGEAEAAAELVPITGFGANDDGTVLSFAPAGGLKPFTEYQVTMDRLVLGELAESSFSWTFRTAASLSDARQGGTIRNADGRIEIYFPPNALAPGTNEISIRRMDRPAGKRVQNGEQTQITDAYTITSVGNLAKRATLSMHYTDDQLAGRDPAKLGIFRQTADQWQRIGGTSDPGGKLLVTAIETLGTFAIFEDLSTLVGGLAVRELDCQPRAFAPRGGGLRDVTDISFILTGPADVTVRIYNASGRLERVIVRDQAMAPGRVTLKWNGQNENRDQVASGLYIVAVNAGGERSEKIVAVVQ